MAKVLIVEDDKYLNKLMADRLALEGFDVKSVLDGEAAWKELTDARDSSQPFDVLLSDMLLPRLMGAELFTRINESNLFPDLQLIAASGIYKDSEQIKEITALHNLKAYFTKPFEMEDLISTISGKASEKQTDKIRNGNLTQISLERLFLEAYDRGFTGRLVLKRGGGERRIYFSRGFPVSADSSFVAESLGRSLVAMNVIDQQTCDSASRQMVVERLQFGQMLLKMQVITKDQLFTAIRKHTYKILLQSFVWRDGEYQFEALAELPSYILALEYNPILLMLKAQKALIPVDLLQSLFETKKDSYCAKNKRCVQILPLFNLDEYSLKFFSGLSGQIPLSKILSDVPAQNHEVLFRVFYLLENLSLVEWKSSPVENEEPQIATADFKENFVEESQLPKDISQGLQAEYMDLLNKDFFEILEVSQDASSDEISESYRNIRYRLHPDRFGNNLSGQAKRILDDMLSRIDKAYQVLASEDSRQIYIATLRKQKSDSLADSKNFLQAQDLYREGLQHLSNQNYKDALKKFQNAYKVWPRGLEYQLYSTYTSFKAFQAENNSVEMEKTLQRLKNEANDQRSSDLGFLLLGHAYQVVNKADLAREAYQQALRLNEQNEEAANALAKLANTHLKKQRITNVVKESKRGLKRAMLWSFILFGSGALYFFRDQFFSKDQGIETLNVADFQALVDNRAVRVDRKSEAARMIVSEGWTAALPDSVFQSKCQELLERGKKYGILEFYVIEQKGGLKAYCKGKYFHRYDKKS